MDVGASIRKTYVWVQHRLNVQNSAQQYPCLHQSRLCSPVLPASIKLLEVGRWSIRNSKKSKHIDKLKWCNKKAKDPDFVVLRWFDGKKILAFKFSMFCAHDVQSKFEWQKMSTSSTLLCEQSLYQSKEHANKIYTVIKHTTNYLRAMKLCMAEVMCTWPFIPYCSDGKFPSACHNSGFLQWVVVCQKCDNATPAIRVDRLVHKPCPPCAWWIERGWGTERHASIQLYA